MEVYVDQEAVLVSLLWMIKEANELVLRQSPDATCVRVDPLGPSDPTPLSYRFRFRPKDGSYSLSIDGTQIVKTGKTTWSPITTAPRILGVTGNLLGCQVDVYYAVRAIRTAGFQDPVFLCGLFQAEAAHITDPWYQYTPTDCHWIDEHHYIFVNALTGAVRLFPPDP